MELIDTFTVSATADRLWEVLTDVELIAPCVPGFQLREAADPEYRGAMRIKVGAITVQYEATIRFVDRDDPGRRAVLSVTGRERRGAGSVEATVTATLAEEQGGRSTATMVTDVQVTGRVAQFGRGIIADVGSRLTQQFVDNLDRRVLNPPAAAPAAAEQPRAAAQPTAAAEQGEEARAPRQTPAPRADTPAEALDLGATAAIPVLKRVGPAVGVLTLILLFVGLRRARR